MPSSEAIFCLSSSFRSSVSSTTGTSMVQSVICRMTLFRAAGS